MIARVSKLLRMAQTTNEDGGLLFASGATVPADTTAGYRTGCIFQHTDGAAGTAFYINEGSVTSSAFAAVAALTAAQEAALTANGVLLAATAGTVSASKAVIVDSSKNITSFGTVGCGAITSTGLLTITSATAGIVINAAEAIGISILTSTPTDGINIAAACANAIAIGGANTTAALNISGANPTAISISAAQTSQQGWDVGVLFQHGSMSSPIAYGTVSTNDMVLMETSISALATGQWVIGQVNQLSSSGISTGYFLGGYNYVLVNHSVGAAIAQYAEVDITATAALSGNVSGLYSEMIVAAGAAVTGAGKIAGLLIEMNVVATATVAQPIHGIEVDMRDIRVDCAGEMIGIKVTMAGGSNYLDYGMQFSNCFDTATAVINFDLTQGNTACAILAEAGAHTITNLIQTSGAVTNLLALPAGGTAPVVASATAAGTAAEGSIAITIGGATKYLQYFAASS